MRLLGTMLPAMLLAGLPAATALAQDAGSASAPAAATTPSTAPAATAPADINQPIGAAPPPDINQPIGAGPTADPNAPIGSAAATGTGQPTDTAPAPIGSAPVLTNGIDVAAVGGSQGYGTPLFTVDDRTNVATPGGAFFGGLPLPALGYRMTASLLSQYQSNLPHLPSNMQPPNGYSKSDFSFSPLVSGSANLPFGRQSVYISGLIGKDFYVRDTGYDHARYSFAGGANLAFGSSCTGNVDANWLQSQANQVGETINIPYTQTTASAGASLGCAPVTGFQPSLTYRYTQARNTSNDPAYQFFRSLNNLDNNNVVLTLGYARPTLGKVALFGSKSFNVFPNRAIGSIQSGVDVTNIGGSYNRNLGSRLYFEASLYWVHTVPQNSPQPSSSNLGYSLNVNYRPSPRIAFTINGSSNSSSSPNNGALYFTNRNFGLQFAYTINPSWDLGLSAITSYRTYKGGSADLPGQLQSDRYTNLRAALNWTSPTRHYRASVFMIQQIQNGTTAPNSPLPDRYDYNNTIAGLSLSFNL